MAKTLRSRVVFFQHRFDHSYFKRLGHIPANEDRFIISGREVLSRGKASWSSLVRMGSRRPVNGFEEEIVDVN